MLLPTTFTLHVPARALHRLWATDGRTRWQSERTRFLIKFGESDLMAHLQLEERQSRINVAATLNARCIDINL